MSQRNYLRPVSILAAVVSLAFMGPAWGHGVPHPATSHGGSTPPEQQEWGIAGDPENVTREFVVRMSDDMRFSPDGITVRANETVRFIIHNDGAVLHEMVIGTTEKLVEHAELMQKFPGMAHDDPWMAHVSPGEQAEIVWKFNRAGRFDFACLLPGHFQAGMTGSIAVEHHPIAQRSETVESIR